MIYIVQKIDQDLPGVLGRKTKVDAYSMKSAAEKWCATHVKRANEEVLVCVTDAKVTREDYFRVKKVLEVQCRVADSTF